MQQYNPYSTLLIDNWTLQFAGDLLAGYWPQGNELSIVVKKKTHTWEKIPSGAIYIESLFQLLTNIIFREQLILDGQYVGAWLHSHEGLDELLEKKIISSYVVNDFSKEIAAPRQEIVKSMCITKSMEAIQKENERQWIIAKTAMDPTFSAIIWGGAGYLARSQALGLTYWGHPLRQLAFEQTYFQDIYSLDMVDSILGRISQLRQDLLAGSVGNENARRLVLPVPVVVLDIIESVDSISDCITVALQMRDYYKKIRIWITKYQSAMMELDWKAIQKNQKFMNDLVGKINSSSTDEKYGKFAINSLLKFIPGMDNPITEKIRGILPEISIPGLKLLRHKVGVRAQINKLVYSKAGIGSLKKLDKLFDLSPSESREIRLYFQSKSK